MIYFDNASTTNKKPFCVKWQLLKALSKNLCANPGRSAHKISVNIGLRIYEARNNFNEKFGNNCVENVIFTSGCTEALNTAILGTVKKGGHIIITSNEHNSVARPIAKLKQDGLISYTVVNARKDRKIYAEDIEKEICKNTYMVITNHCSNVTGEITNISAIGKICKEHSLLYLVDCAQSAGHIKINMQKDNINIIAIAGHKGLLGPQGVGVLIFNKDVKILPLKMGGTGANSENLLPPVIMPESLESGTVCSPNIVALNSGLNYVYKHFDKLNEKIKNITKYIIDELLKIDKVVLYTNKTTFNGVICFNIKGLTPADVANLLNEKNIYIRGGMHCAPLVHQNLGTLSGGGTCRISVGNNNTIFQAKKLIYEIKKLCE